MFELAQKMLDEGMAEIFDEFNKGKPMQFMEILSIINPRTGKGYSPNTVSKRVKTLAGHGLIKRILLDPNKSRVAYVITKQGKLILRAARMHEKKLADLLKGPKN